ncbi:MAG TPA: hypothetical protein V6C76_00100 [Drouetiella sp.]
MFNPIEESPIHTLVSFIEPPLFMLFLGWHADFSATETPQEKRQDGNRDHGPGDN